MHFIRMNFVAEQTALTVGEMVSVVEMRTIVRSVGDRYDRIKYYYTIKEQEHWAVGT